MLKKDEVAPGATGCLAKAKDDEMIFTLLSRDMQAPLAIIEWIKLSFNSQPADKLREALECAIVMKQQWEKNLNDSIPEDIKKRWLEVGKEEEKFL